MCEKVFLKRFRKKEIEGRKVVGIILFRKAGKRIYREMPLLLDNEGDEVFGETWRGAWVKVVEYPVQWNIEGASSACSDLDPSAVICHEKKGGEDDGKSHVYLFSYWEKFDGNSQRVQR